MPTATQLTFDDLGPALHETTFVVVDLETDGGSPTDAGITEIGAVKVRAGEVVGEFQTLVRLGRPLPAFIRALTGITDEMLLDAPPLAAVLPGFLEFAHGAVLVAHNAPYDVGFLRGACVRLDLAWPDPPVLDTARLARHVLTRDEVPNCKLATLARHFRTTSTPNHRALADARATVDVLHGLMERVGNLGVHSLTELQGYSSRVPEARRRKRGLADGLPEGPGVYVFEDAQGAALYVGTSRCIRRRVLSYFTAAEQRRRMTEMVALAHKVVAVPCATPLEAQVRELRTIAARAPRYNRRSVRPQSHVWLKLTVERFPRISVVTGVRDDHADGARYVGPFASRRTAQAAAEALAEALPLRTCTQPLTSRPKASACVLADLGRCPAPCVGAIDEAGYAALVASARQALAVDPLPLVAPVQARMAALAEQERYEEAAAWRDRLTALLRGIDVTATSDVLGRIEHLVAARATDDLGWEVHVIRHGRLAAAATIPPGVDPIGPLEAVVAGAEHVPAPHRPATAALPEETQVLARWLFTPGVRLVDLHGGVLALPRRGAGAHRGAFEVDLRQAVPAGLA
ncbi:MAG: DEDD exonuclease domain-containing protein [Candidatus Nanopelagicales bacterium]|jgi:DNA polymerase-3 subunit epsilon|nr:DEDD exonuclease domain-containing protein [Candidatus Nanopelagicales bacterium]